MILTLSFVSLFSKIMTLMRARLRTEVTRSRLVLDQSSGPQIPRQGETFFLKYGH